MLKFSHTTLIVISGFIWMAVGISLLSLGLGFMLEGTHSLRLSDFPLLSILSPYMGGTEEAALLIIAISLFIGYLKGRYVLGKSANQGVERILTFTNPTHLKNIYNAKYYILLAAMVTMGVSIKYLGIPKDVRGMIDVIVGAALINGAMFYFRWALSLRIKPA